MKTPVVLGGAAITLLLVFGFWLYREVRKAVALVCTLTSKDKIASYLT